MDQPSSDARLHALWEVYCLAKRRATSPDADQFDHVELQIALDEFAEALVAFMAKTGADGKAVARRTHPVVQ